MSTHVTVHIGPVARCKIEQVSSKSKGCTNSGGKCPMGGKKALFQSEFCPRCGSKIGEIEIPGTAEKVNPWTLFGDEEPLSNCLSSDGTERLFTPNQRRSPPREFSFQPEYDSFEKVFDANTIAVEIAWFKAAFGIQIAELEHVYGAVAIDWMVFMEWS